MAIKEVNIGDLAARSAEAEKAFEGDQMMINMGPSHPATHGVLRLKVEMNGETITRCEPVIG
ncbi:MAG: hypothetical protein RL648_1330 [Verrucomicrobiota bacterium]